MQDNNAPPMSYNTTDGQPPMSLVGGGTNQISNQQIPQMVTLSVPSAILQHPAVRMGVQQATQDMAKGAASIQSPTTAPSSFQDFQNQYPGVSRQTFNHINSVRAMQDADLMNPNKKHPIGMAIANAMMAFGQGITKQPFYTSFQEQQTERMKQLANMANTQELTPAQQIALGLRQQAIENVQNQRDQSNWSQFINKVNPATASSRSTLGMTSNGSLRANRALAAIQNNPVMTFQDLGNVIGDLAGIYQGGAPTDMGMKHQQYDSIQTHIANMKQFMTGNPQDAVPPAIKAKIIDTINGLKSVNNQALKVNLNAMEKAQKGLIAKHPEEWSEFRKNIESDYMGGGDVKQGMVPNNNSQFSPTDIAAEMKRRGL